MSKNLEGGIGGTSRKFLRCEAVRVALTGDIANYYDVYYVNGGPKVPFLPR